MSARPIVELGVHYINIVCIHNFLNKFPYVLFNMMIHSTYEKEIFPLLSLSIGVAWMN